MVKEGFSKEVTFKQRPELQIQMCKSHIHLGRAFQIEGTANANEVIANMENGKQTSDSGVPRLKEEGPE
jgi:hypothetical protein